MRVIVLASSKGGVGKTTLTAAFAVEAQRQGRVGLLDRDPQQSLARWFELRQLHGKATGSMVVIEAAKTLEATLAVARAAGCDFLFIDTPPAMMTAIKPAIDAADIVLVPVRPSPVDIEAVGPVKELAEMCNKPFLFILNAVEPRGGGLVDGARAYLAVDGPVAEQTVANRKAYIGSMATGESAVEVDKTGRAASEIGPLWLAIFAQMTPPALSKAAKANV